jgi:hypothetical protein
MPAPDAEGAVTRTTAVAREPTPEQLAYQQQLALRQHMAAQQAYHQQIYQQQAYQQQMAAGQQQGSGGAMPAGYALAAPLAAPAMLAQQAGFGQPMPAQMPGPGGRAMPVSYDQPHMPNYAWPAYAPQNNYSRVTYPKEYSPTAWPFIGPFYPYPQVPLGWRKVTLEWDDGWWRLKFRHHRR